MRSSLILLSLCLVLSSLSAEVIDKIVAKVGSDIILRSDLQKQMMQIQSTGVKKEDIQPIDVLQQMVEQKLMVQKAKELDLKVDKDRIKSYAQRYLNQLKAKYPSEAAFNADLARMKLTQNDLLDYYVDMITDNALQDMLVERYVSSKVEVPEAEMRSFYEASKDSMAVKPTTWKVGMIMREVKPSQDSDAAQLTAIKAVLQRLLAGEDFATLAKTESDCPSSAQGGDLGFFGKGQMVKPFEDAAFSLDVGEISNIVKTQFGYHIIKVEEKRGDQIRARHILKIVSPATDDTLNARNEMEMIRAKYVNGEAGFADLATQYTEDPEAAKNGGIIGEMTEAEMPELFASAIMSTPVGEMTPVLENEGMFYLFIRTEELPARLMTFEEVKDQVYEYLFTQKQMEEYQVWMGQLMEESYVQITP